MATLDFSTLERMNFGKAIEAALGKCPASKEDREQGCALFFEHLPKGEMVSALSAALDSVAPDELSWLAGWNEFWLRLIGVDLAASNEGIIGKAVGAFKAKAGGAVDAAKRPDK